MSTKSRFTKENLDSCLKELGKEFRRLNGTAIPAEVVLIGGAAILANYGFRDMTYDIDAVIMASSAMKDAVNHVGDRLGLPNGWLNMDFKQTNSYSDRLAEVSIYYKTYSNVLTVRMVAAEYLVAMKLMSGRQYKNDLSDIVGILWEHEKRGNPISREAIDRALGYLYVDRIELSAVSQKFIDDLFTNSDYEKVYREIRESERQAKEVLLDFDQNNPKVVNEDNIDAIIEKAVRIKKRQGC